MDSPASDTLNPQPSTESDFELESELETELETGLESEKEEEGLITDPFDPEQIRIRTIPILISQLVSRIKYQEIDLAPDFQRLRGIWNAERRSRLIESIMLRIPIPVFYVAAKEDESWLVVDGLQRMSTINDFVNDELPLKHLEYLASYEGNTHDDLPRHMQRRISETQLIFNVIEPGTPEDVMFNVFLRINTGGMILNRQEIRHAMYAGPVRCFLKELAESNEFLTATGGSVNPRRMADRECILRFLAFHISPPEKYETNNLDSFLSTTIDCINKMNPEQRDACEREFKKAMRAAYEIFGDDAFRKRTSETDNKRPVSRALFEVWSVQLARYSQDQIDEIVKHKRVIIDSFMDLIRTNSEFDKAISYSTGSPQRVYTRFKAIEQLIKGFIPC